MDYIVTCAERLSWPDLEPFVRSARACAPQARLVFFTTRLPPGTVARLREAGVELQGFDGIFPEGQHRTQTIRHCLWRGGVFLASRLRYQDFTARLLWRWGGLLLPRNQARFFSYRCWLEDCTQDGDRLLLCDARDLVFQNDPFARFQPAAFVVEEDPSILLRDNSYNTRWYRETYGASQLARHGDRPVVCAGVIGGERTALRLVLDVFISESCRRPFLYGADQAIINHLYYENRLGCQKLANGAGMVWHLYGATEGQVEVDGAEIISAPGQPPCAIVHMYDRLDKTLQAVNRRWRSS